MPDDHAARHADLDTPALVLDLDALERNIAKMADRAREQGFALRPHAKTHKSGDIGRLQMEAGAVGLCCAKLSEAEALADQGLTQLLITSPMVGSRKLDRLMALHSRIDGLMVVLDDAGQLESFSERLKAGAKPLKVLVDVDVGTHRTGATSLGEAFDLARRMAATEGIELAGVQGYAGHIQHIADFDERREAALESATRLKGVVAAIRGAGLPCEVVTGGGTGTSFIDPGFDVYTDIQTGSYVFSDVEYDAVALDADDDHPFDNALFVLSQVISARHSQHATIDAGSKSLSMDGPLPAIAAPGNGAVTYERFSDEFGILSWQDPEISLRPGDRVLCVVPHCDPTVNMHSDYVCLRGSDVASTWPIHARGAST